MNSDIGLQKSPTFQRIIIPIIYVSFIIFTILHFIVPFLHEEGSIPNLRFSYENQKSIDLGHQEPVNEFFFDYIYLIGHFTCHQRSDRSFYLNDNQLPVCSRCLGIYLGMSLVFLIALWQRPRGSFFQSLCQLIRFNRTLKKEYCDFVIIICLGAILAIPMLADGFLQIFTSYVSNDFTRLITGFIFGLFEGGFVVGLLSHLAFIFKHDTNYSVVYS